MSHKVEGIKYNQTQHLDLYLQEQPGRPLIICLHGGGFISGSRDDERCSQSAKFLTDAGYNCASVSYSLAPAENRFQMWPRNLFDVADAMVFLNSQSSRFGYDFARLAMLGFSAGCCLSNLYIHGGKTLFEEFGYATPVFDPVALIGFYGPYDFPSRQPERRSEDESLNIKHSPSHWFKRNNRNFPPVLHIQGKDDVIVYPDQHEMFKSDYLKNGYSFASLLLEGFGHSFSPLDSNASGTEIDTRGNILEFLSKYVD